MDGYEFRYVRGHIEVFLNGEFLFSADTMREAREELRLMASKIVKLSRAETGAICFERISNRRPGRISQRMCMF